MMTDVVVVPSLEGLLLGCMLLIETVPVVTIVPTVGGGEVSSVPTVGGGEAVPTVGGGEVSSVPTVAGVVLSLGVLLVGCVLLTRTVPVGVTVPKVGG